MRLKRTAETGRATQFGSQCQAPQPVGTRVQVASPGLDLSKAFAMHR